MADFQTLTAAIKRIVPAELARRLREPGELAVLDVRELGEHIEDGHILQSAPLPLGRLELRVASLLPRRDVPIVVYDADAGEFAARAAAKLAHAGYGDVAILAGGVAAWARDGFEVYTGVHVLSKAFGEFVEHVYKTPHIDARALKAHLDAGDDVVVLDGRTLEEFENFSVPGAWACPNAELPFRVHDLAPRPDTLVVVNCAGRTRSIIGAQALINAGIPNRVVSLENGTMAWLKEGFVLASGLLNAAPPPTEEGRRRATAAAAGLRQRFGVRTADRATLASLAADTTRTLYRLDVRTRAEYEAGHVPGSLWAQGGELVQATDKWVGVRGARIVLIDDADGVRAAITASWLIQLAWSDVFAYAIDPAGEVLETGPQPALVAGRLPAGDPLPVAEAHRLLEAGGLALFDVSPSTVYRRGHIPGAVFALRSRLDARAAERAAGRAVAVTADDPNLALLAAADLEAIVRAPVRVLAGGTAAWTAAGLALEAGGGILLDEPTDVWTSPYDEEDRFAAFQRYLDWEVGLLDQLKRDTTVEFRTF